MYSVAELTDYNMRVVAARLAKDAHAQAPDFEHVAVALGVPVHTMREAVARARGERVGTAPAPKAPVAPPCPGSRAEAKPALGTLASYARLAEPAAPAGSAPTAPDGPTSEYEKGRRRMLRALGKEDAPRLAAEERGRTMFAQALGKAPPLESTPNSSEYERGRARMARALGKTL